MLFVPICHLVDNPARDAHAVEDGHVDDGGHSSVVDGLGAVRPHVGTLGQVDITGRQTGRRQERVSVSVLGVRLLQNMTPLYLFTSCES